MNNKRSQAGFSLIEVLVALVVLSTGLIGLSVSQIMNVKNNHDSFLRAQASFWAFDIADNMRSNVAGVIRGRYKITSSPQSTVDCVQTTATQITPCSESQVADYQLQYWFQTLAESLPNGTGTINCSDSNGSDVFSCSRGSTHIIEVIWRESDAEVQSFRTEVQI